MSENGEKIIELVRRLDHRAQRASITGWNDAIYDLSGKISTYIMDRRGVLISLAGSFLGFETKERSRIKGEIRGAIAVRDMVLDSLKNAQKEFQSDSTTVYVAKICDEDEVILEEGVFSTKALAEKWVDEQTSGDLSDWTSSVYEHVLDNGYSERS